jgi:hypothetical protein
LNTYRALKRVRLTGAHTETGNTVHFSGVEKLAKPAVLEVGQYGDDSGFYLFYIDGAGETQNDTYHDTLDHALEQARFEFNVAPDEWQDVDEGHAPQGDIPVADWYLPAGDVDVVLLDRGPRGLDVMQALLEMLPGCNLASASRLSQSTSTLGTRVARDFAERLKERLESDGAKVEIRPSR